MERMKKIFGGLAWTIVIAGVAYGGYYFYGKWMGTSLLDDIFTGAKKTATRTVDQAAEGVKGAVSDYARQGVGNAISSVGEELRTYGETLATGKAGTSSASAVPVPVQGNFLTIRDIVPSGNIVPRATTSGFLVPAPSTAILLKVGVPLLFAINPNVQYSIDWGDQKIEEGDAKKTQTALVSHTWEKEGDYTVLVSVEDGVKTIRSSFPVRVYR